MNEKIESAVKPWIEAVLEKNTAKKASLNAYLTVNSKTGQQKSSIGSACYGSIGNYFNEQQDVIINWIATGNAMSNWICSHGDGKFTFTRNELINFFSYLARRSPYSSAFIDKHCGNMVDNQYVLMNPELPGNLVVAAMTAQRQAWEYTRTVKMFMLLRKRQPKGNPDWHFLLAQLLEPVVRRGNSVKFKVAPVSTGHTPLNSSSFSMENAENFLKHEMPGKKKQPLTRDHSYYGVNDLFGPGIPYETKEKPLYQQLEAELKLPEDKLDIEDTNFAWNTQFSGLTEKDLSMYSLQDNLPVFEEFYNQHFGGIT